MFLYGLVVELFNKPGYSISQWIRIFFYKFPEYSLWVYPILFGSLWFMPVFIGVSLIVFPFRFIDEFLDEANRKKLGFSIAGSSFLLSCMLNREIIFLMFHYMFCFMQSFILWAIIQKMLLLKSSEHSYFILYLSS